MLAPDGVINFVIIFRHPVRFPQNGNDPLDVPFSPACPGPKPAGVRQTPQETADRRVMQLFVSGALPQQGGRFGHPGVAGRMDGGHAAVDQVTDCRPQAGELRQFLSVGDREDVYAADSQGEGSPR